MSDPGDSETRSRCLTLSIFSQAVVDALTRAPLLDSHGRAVLGDALRLLGEVERGEPNTAAGPATGLRPFLTYEQVTLLYEVLGPNEAGVRERLGRINSTLRAVLVGAREDQDEATAGIAEALRVFRQLAIKAQDACSRDFSCVPHRVVEFCRAAREAEAKEEEMT